MQSIVVLVRVRRSYTHLFEEGAKVEGDSAGWNREVVRQLRRYLPDIP